jgi:flagellar biosynthesis GTPase FlhF
MGRGAERKKRWKRNKRLQGLAWSEIQGPSRGAGGGVGFGSISTNFSAPLFQSTAATTNLPFLFSLGSRDNDATTERNEGERKRKREEEEAESQKAREEKEINEELLNSSGDSNVDRTYENEEEDTTIQSLQKLLTMAKQSPDLEEENIEKDIEHILMEHEERKKRCKTICREGRERFREKVLERFDNRCVVTGCEVHPLSAQTQCLFLDDSLVG